MPRRADFDELGADFYAVPAQKWLRLVRPLPVSILQAL